MSKKKSVKTFEEASQELVESLKPKEEVDNVEVKEEVKEVVVNEVVNSCLFPNCKKESKSRGLCANHYSTAANLVKAGRTTWLSLESAGKCKTASKGRKSKISGWFMS